MEQANASVLAAAVTDMKAAEVTEYLTSATKQYGSEVSNALEFVDAWINVDVKHAITATNLARSLLRVGSIAKTAGMSFHELNGVITAIGSVTRQSGKEIGTSLRFIFRNLQTSAVRTKLRNQLGIETVLPSGSMKPAFRLLEELNAKWATLSTHNNSI